MLCWLCSTVAVGVWYMLQWVGCTIAVGECYILGGCVIHVAVAVWQTAAPTEKVHLGLPL